MNQTAIPAVYMRGGTSKGVFFSADDLPVDPVLRDKILLRVIGSPDPYGQHIDGMGGATSSTSKVIVIQRSQAPDCDIDYSFGQVSIEKPVIDWSGNCGNLTSAVGPFAIAQKMVDVGRQGTAIVRLRHRELDARIVAHIPLHNGAVAEDGDFALDGVTFPAAEIVVEFLNPAGVSLAGGLFPTGHPCDILQVPGLGPLDVTMINAGNPAVFVTATQIGLSGDELQKDINTNPTLLARLEAIRAHAAVRMGLAATVEEATAIRLHTPKLAFLSKPSRYTASNGKPVEPSSIDLNARIVSMGKLHHAMTGTGAIALATAAAIPGTVVQRILGVPRTRITLGHPSGTMTAGAEVALHNGSWNIVKAVMSRSARRLMEGNVFVPARLLRPEADQDDLVSSCDEISA
jgi:2-methylaconitate isomerase